MASSSSPSSALPVILVGHSDRVWHSAWHPSGSLLATCGGDRTVRIWQPKGSKVTLAGADGAVSLNPSWTCVCVLDDFTVRTVRRCEWSPDGKLLACASFDGKVTVWHFPAAPPAKGSAAGSSSEASGGDRMAEDETRALVEGDEEGFADLSSSSSSSSSSSPSSSSSSSSALSSTATNPRRPTLKGELVATLEGHENEVKAVAWNADGSLLASCGRDKSVWIWMLASPEAFDFEVLAVLHGHTQDVKALAWHSKRDLLLSASYDDSLKLWGESSDGDWVCAQTLLGHGSTVWALAFSPGDGRYFASVSDDCKLILWESRLPTTGDINENPHAIDDLLLWRQAKCIDGQHDRTIFSVDWTCFTDNDNDSGSAGDGKDAGEGNKSTTAGGGGGGDVIATVGADDRLVLYRPSNSTAATADGDDGDDDSASHDPAAASLARGSSAAGSSSSVNGKYLRTFEVSAVIEKSHSADVNSCRWHPYPESLSSPSSSSSEGATGTGTRRKDNHNVLVTTGDDGLVKLWWL